MRLDELGEVETSTPVPLPEPIWRQIEAEGGRVPFARFMELALTHPQEGYYRQGVQTIGPRGDFSTAPGLVPLFSQAMARLLADLVDTFVAAEGASGKASSGLVNEPLSGQ
ncbi:MAG: hypothetical protein H5T84_05505, partial [Thermoleophilia bacterium]|nr:hypothetical protein [Thermoleophilia bacterium]